jgi:hypothetical protein
MASNDSYRTLLNTASFLNDKVSIGISNTVSFNNQISENSTSIQQNKVILQDIRDAIETKNKEFLDRSTDIKKNGVPKKQTLQDWSLIILYSGVGIFSFLLLVYIFLPANNVQYAFLKATVYLLLLAIFFITIIFVIQRYG